MIALAAFYWYGLVIAFLFGLATAYWTWGRLPAPAMPLGAFIDPYEEPITWPSYERPAFTRPEMTAVVREAAPTADQFFSVRTDLQAFAPELPETTASPLMSDDLPVPAFEDATDEPAIGPDPLGPAIAAAAFAAFPEEPDGAAQDDAGEPAVEPSNAPDDLLMIKGIGPGLARRLNSLGVRRFDDIAGWLPDDIELIDTHLGEYRGRIIRDEWIQQARLLASGDMETFEQRYGHLRF